MSDIAEATTERPSSPIAVFRSDIDKMGDEFAKTLPSHITPERFQRVAVTAVQNTPDLLEADRRSLLSSCMKAAQDGLLPDGREGAIVTFNTKEKDGQGKDKWVKKAQWMPMVAGILKKVRNSGELATISAQIVYADDEFDYSIDEQGEHIQHRPELIGDRGSAIAAYAVAKTRDGSVFVEVMTREQIEQVRSVSKAKNNGPWMQWWDEMAKKTVIRRLSKRLPMSSDVEQVVHRDDELYEFRRAARDMGSIPREPGAGIAAITDAMNKDAETGPDVIVATDEPAQPEIDVELEAQYGDLMEALRSTEDAGHVEGIANTLDDLAAEGMPETHIARLRDGIDEAQRRIAAL